MWSFGDLGTCWRCLRCGLWVVADTLSPSGNIELLYGIGKMGKIRHRLCEGPHARHC